MKNFKYLLIIVAAVMLFASCSDDGDEGGIEVSKSLEGKYEGLVTDVREYLNPVSPTTTEEYMIGVEVFKDAQGLYIKFSDFGYDNLYLTNNKIKLTGTRSNGVEDVLMVLEISLANNKLDYSWTQSYQDRNGLNMKTIEKGLLDKM